MPKENELTAVNTVSDVDKIRVVTSAGLSQSIEVGHLKNSLSVDDLPGRVGTLETKANTNETDHVDMSSRIDELELVVGEETVDGEIVTSSGLFQKISGVRSELTTFHLGEVNRLDSELNGIRARLTVIDGTNGRLDIIDGTNGRLDVLEGDIANLDNIKLDQAAFQSAVAAGFKVIGKTPANASAAGEPGEVCWDTEYFYVCVGPNTWKRTPLESW